MEKANNIEKKVDLRVIDMICHGKPSINPENSGSWIALGHFDQITVTELPAYKNHKGVDLARVVEHNRKISLDKHKDDTSYYQRPQYILREYSNPRQTNLQEPTDLDLIRLFWETPTAFMTITRIHSRVMKSLTEFEAEILNNLKALSKSTLDIYAYQDSIRKHTLNGGISFILYRTLELSDFILIAKSNEAKNLMLLVGQLCYLPNAGDTYSHFCVAVPWNQAAKLACDEKMIPFVLTRLAVEDVGKCREYMIKFKSECEEKNVCIVPPILTTGTEDLTLIARDLTSRALCDYFQMIYSIEPSPHESFRDMITRLSVFEEELTIGNGEGQKSSKEDQLKDNQYSIQDEYLLLEKQFCDSVDYYLKGHPCTEGRLDKAKLPNWVRPIREYLRSMRTISKDVNLWQTCYTLLGGTRSLVRLSGELFDLEQGKKGVNYESEKGERTAWLHKIFTGTSDLLEHMIRMESEIIHYPETRPLLYDIPANLLELYLCLSNRCLVYFQKREDYQLKKKYQLWINPCLCPTIQVANSRLEIREENETLCVEIPLHRLYQPRYVITNLIHEVAHYGGEEARCRTSRFAAFCYCVAFYIAVRLNIDKSNDAISILKCSIESTINRNVDPNERDYMYALCPAMKVAMLETGISCDYLLDQNPAYHKAYHNMSVITGSNTDRHLCSTEFDSEAYNFLSRVIDELAYLFKESYADLAMLQLLDLDSCEYVRMLGRELVNDGTSTYACAVERAALALCTLRPATEVCDKLKAPKDESIEEPEKEPGFRGFAQDVYNYIEWLNNGTSPQPPHGDYYHYFEAVSMIRKYLNKCLSLMVKFDTRPENHSEAERIRNEFIGFAQNARFASDDFFNTLETYRCELLNS